MDIRFDAQAAERLLEQMDIYCTGMQKETKGLLAILEKSEQWDDNQMKAFQANITDIAEDLNQALDYQKPYPH